MAPEVFGNMSNSDDKILFQIFTHCIQSKNNINISGNH
jgi:hypothetical protein